MLDAVTRNDDCFEGSDLYTLSRILKRTVGLSYNRHISRIVGPTHTKHVRQGSPAFLHHYAMSTIADKLQKQFSCSSGICYRSLQQFRCTAVKNENNT